MKAEKHAKKLFTKQLMDWHQHHNNRSLPWKQESDPYKIWLSEIILQQTRAEQGLPYYLRFIERYPTIGELAAAPDEEVFRLWQGLGYYNRCKNLLYTARTITEKCAEKFPDKYQDLLELKGVGEYTAAAIASFAYKLPHAVVDGNVYRVLSRYFGIETPIDSTAGKLQFKTLANELLCTEDSAAYNQAIMDHGATVCTPATPACTACPLTSLCVAYRQNLTGLLPVKSKKQTVRTRYFHYLLLRSEDKIWIHKREKKDIWQNLYEPYLIEASQPLTKTEIRDHESYPAKAITPVYEGQSTQRLTHQLIEARFFSVNFGAAPGDIGSEGSWIRFSDLKKFAFPKTLVSFLEKKLYF